MAHSVEEHLGFRASEYDDVILNVIPEYGTMHAMIVRWCQSVLPTNPKIIDLGGGTGSLTAAIAESFKDAQIEVWDIDPKMIEIGRHRLAKYGNRVQFVQRSFEEPLPMCDAVVTCIALHHVKDSGKKTRIYTNICRALRSPGIFANGDATMSLEKNTAQATYRLWTDFMLAKGLTDTEAQQHFANWSEEDRYFSLEEEFDALKAAGFTHPDCFWKHGPMTVYGGIKRQ
jgi:tRNA (cmo5U34)-methyltransferase